MKATGSLRVKRGIWQVVIDYVDEQGNRRQRSESTKLPERSNKRKAQEILDTRLKELEGQYTAALEQKSVPFLSFMRQWLDDVVPYRVRETTATQYNYVYSSYIAKYKPFHGVKLQALISYLITSPLVSKGFRLQG